MAPNASFRPAEPSDGVAWITGASSGIGAALALTLARRGWTVIATARREQALADLAAEAAGGRIHPLPGDVTDAVGVDRMVARIEEEHGPIALAVLNAGTYTPDGVANFDRSRFADTLRLNLQAGADAMQALFAVMRPRKHGQIALVSSVAGYRGLPNAASYSAGKAGAIALMESLRLEGQTHGLLLQVVNPGFVKTPLTDKNTFPMPFLVPVEKAASIIADGLRKTRFEIAFPGPFVFLLKIFRALPYGVFFWLIRRQTGVGK